MNCHTQMAGVGQVSFRVAGYPAPISGYVGGWNPGDTLQMFSLYFCRQCGKYDLYYAGS